MRFPHAGLTRRALLINSAVAFAGTKLSATPSCTLTPEQEEGPYYVDAAMFRRTLTEEKPGVPLQLRIALVDAKRCTPLEDAAIDIWHCDATGVYSGFTANGGGGEDARGPGGPPPPGGGPGGRGRGFGGPPPGGRGRGGGRGPRAVDSTRFLRGVQVTNQDGVAEFGTIYPGWYAGRTIHIHLKVHLGGTTRDTYQGGHVAHTGQLFLPEDITASVAEMNPYRAHTVHRTLQVEDHVFLDQGGAQTVMHLERLTRGSNDEGFVATVTLAVDPNASPTPF